MKANVGSVDKVIRIIAALALFSLFFVLEGNMRYLAVIGLVPLVTALVSWCPLYTLFGLSTCSLHKAN
jgi:hypothetical protein